jgi:rRNA-processing protein EBP2
MARQKITSKKTISQPGDEDIKDDTHSKLVQPAPPHEVDASESDESRDDDDDDEDSGVDKEGLEKLMNALGEDGLSEFDLAQLRMLSGAAADEEEGSNGEEEDSSGGDIGTDPEEEAEAEEAGDGIALDDDDVDSVDQDAIPRRKIQVDNKVRPFPLSSLASSSYIMGRSRSNAYGTPSNSTNHFRGPRH